MAQAVIALASLDGSNGFALNGVAAGDVSGVSVSDAGDVNGDGIDDLIIGAPGVDLGYDYYGSSGQSYVVFGSKAGFPASLELAALDGTDGFVLNGAPYDGLSGLSVSAAGDVNGDGIDDLIIGAPDAGEYDTTEFEGQGLSYVVFGSTAGFDASLELPALDGTDGFVLKGVGMEGNSGFSVSGAGDVNGDGIDDLIIGAPESDFPYSYKDTGQSYVVFGSKSGFSASLELSTLDGGDGFTLIGSPVTDSVNSGRSVSAAGDVNGDGIDDLIVGARGPSGNNSGQSHVVFGSDAGFAPSLELSALDGTDGFALNGGAEYHQSGTSVSAAGDVNGDGIDDLIVGAPYASPNGKHYAGRSYVVFGSTSGFAASLALSALDGGNGFAIDGVSPGDTSGSSVSAAGDVNGDGVDDLIVGAPANYADRPSSGQSYVVFGSGSGFPAALKLSALDGSNGFAVKGVAREDRSGASVSAAGDVNGDGIDDLIVGAPNADPNGDYSGQSYVVFGVRTPLGKTLSGGPEADVLSGTAFADTVVGRGGNDQLKGRAGGDMMRGGAGDDVLKGDGGGDTLKGGGGDDTLGGGVGYDVLLGNTGDDILRGGAHADRFVFRAAFGADTIGDFDAAPFSGQDVIDLRDLGISEATFDDFVTITDLGGNTLVTVEDFGTILLKDVNGVGANVVDASDFLLLA